MRNMPAHLSALIDAAKQAKGSKEVAATALHTLDLTSLTGKETEADIDALCEKADQGKFGKVAAVCVYMLNARQAFNKVAHKNINVATVLNFPEGSGSPGMTFLLTLGATDVGANEVDIVLDYKSFKEGDRETPRRILETCRKSCELKTKMKVILESAEFKTYQDLYDASMLAIESGANFIKTSTGKSEKGGATLEAAAVMLQAIKDSGAENVGLKVSGGVKTVDDAAQYISLAESMMGKGWVTPQTFRFGASGVLDDIMNVLNDCARPAPSGPAPRY